MTDYKSKNPQHAITVSMSGLSNIILTEVNIVNSESNHLKSTTKAIWDTGASRTVITEELAKSLKLIERGITFVNTATIQNQETQTYFVDVDLRNGLVISGVEVVRGVIMAEHGINCLIGMDIIALGDFSITNFQGKTCMTFRVPSMHKLDYADKINKEQEVIARHIQSKKSINATCACGSGRKFKNCHGKDLEKITESPSYSPPNPIA